MAGKRKQAPGPRSEAKQERQLFLSGLLRKGLPLGQVYRVMCGKFSVTPQTVRKDIKEIGATARKFLEDENNLEAEIAAVVDRLKKRAQREDSVGNRADEILSSLLTGYSVRAAQRAALDVESRLKEANARLAESKAEAARHEADRDRKWSRDANKRINAITRSIIERGAASISDMVELVGLIIQRQLKNPDSNNVHLMQSLRLLSTISLSDPSAMAADQQLFKVPEGLLKLDIKPDSGDEILANA